MNQKKSNQTHYNEFLISKLKETVFASGSQLCNELVKEFEVSNDNARKILQRAAQSRVIKSSKPYTFGKKQFIYLLPTNRLRPSDVIEVCRTSRPPLYRLLSYIAINGIISKYEALKITGSPKIPSSTKVESLDDMIKLLKGMEFVYEASDGNGINYIIFRQKIKKDSLEETAFIQTHRNKMVADCCLLPDIIRWMVKINLIDNLKIAFRNKKTPSKGVVQNNLVWDALAYTKTTGINDILGAKADSLGKQTIVVMDVVLSEEYTEMHLDGFYARIQINRNSVKTTKRKTLPIIVYRNCSQHIQNKIRKLGFLAFDIGSIFGSNIYSVLNKLNEINDRFIQKGIENTIEEVLDDIKKSGQEEALRNLKGILFEAMMYPLISKLFPQAKIHRGKTLSLYDEAGKKTNYEYDYIVDSNEPEEIVIIELKGYLSNTTIAVGDENKKSTLKWFFGRTVPFAKKVYKDRASEGTPIRAVFLTTAKFWKDGKDYIAKFQDSRLKSSNMNIAYDRNELLKLLSRYSLKNEIKIIKKFYAK